MALPSHFGLLASRAAKEHMSFTMCLKQHIVLSHLFYVIFCSSPRILIYFPSVLVLYCHYGGSAVKNACQAGDECSDPGLGRSPEEGNGKPLQYSFLRSPVDTGACWAIVHDVSKSRTRLSN